MRVENLYAEFSKALEMIVNSEAPMVERVHAAFHNNLARLDADALPEKIKEQFLTLKKRLSIDEPKYDLDETLNMACELIDMADMVRLTQYNLKNAKERRNGISDRRKNYKYTVADRRNGIADRRQKHAQNSYAI